MYHFVFDQINRTSQDRQVGKINRQYALKHNQVQQNMDIEGGEFICLSAMKNYLRKKKPILLLSLHPGFLLSEKWRNRPTFVRYVKRFMEQKKIYDAIKFYPYIYDAVDLKQISAFSIYKMRYIRSKSAHNSQILCTKLRIEKPFI